MPSQVDATAAPPEALGSSPEMRKLFVKHAHAAVKVLSSASTVSGKSDGQGDLLPFNEINIPNNTDWSLILAWIVNKLHLYNIPAHYLITDPTHLPKESIRFFYIDPTWLDSLIDGALSVGNHLERDDDVVRQAMKFNLNKYFATPIHQDHHPFTPQIPTYGFFLRSAVVQAFPNLQVHAPWPGSTPANPDPRVETLRLDLLDKDLLICLFDRLPGSLDFASGITISQPPHQQRFAAGNDRVKAEVKNANEVEFIFRRVYTSTEVEPPPNTWADLSLRAWGEGEGEISHTVDPKSKILDPPNPSVIFDWDNNTLVVEAFAKTCNNVLLQEMDKKYFDDATPSSALVGIQLNDANKVITILTPRDSPPNPNPRPDSRPRFIHLTADDLPPAAPVTALSSIEQIVAAPRPAGIFPGMFRSSAFPRPDSRLRFIHLTAGDLPPAAPVTALGSIEQLTTVPRPAGIFPGMFHSSAFVIGNVGNPTLPTHPSNSLNLPVDIIFALTLSGQINDSLNLFQVRIRIPIGTALGHLFAVYDGPGGRMLSNQRFNVHVGSATTDNFVFVTLIPRSTTQLVPLKVNPDVSFILNQVRLNGVAGLVNMIVEEDYRVKGEGDDPTKWPLVGPGRTLITVRKVIISST
jgi:hypothetical protein